MKFKSLMQVVLETERLLIREFELIDAKFILELVNSSSWIKYLGNKEVYTIEEAKAYIANSLKKSYLDNTFGLWLVLLKECESPIGMCGLVKREGLDIPDIGFAFLPRYIKMGYGFESATAVLNYVKRTLQINTVLAITKPENKASIKLISKLGFIFKESKEISNKLSLVFTSQLEKSSIKDLDRLTTDFFNVFTNTHARKPNLDKLRKILIPEARIINNTKIPPAIYSLEEFIIPREKILNKGILTNFEENEVFNITKVFGNIASRSSLYKKEGQLNGVKFKVMGQKDFQFIKIDNQWKINSLIWCDEIKN